MVRPPNAFKEIAKEYICVRITNINDYNLNLFTFDYDLTMAILLANADGTVYHRYGGRSDISPMHIETLMDFLKKGLSTHQTYLTNKKPPAPKPELRVDELVNQRMQGMMNPVFGCIHCHYVREANQYHAMESKTWTPNQFWIWPRPERLGLVMDQNRQYLVESVHTPSSAQKAGIQSGDRLLSLGHSRILTKYDIQWVLENSPDKAFSLPFTVSRNDRSVQGILELQEAWKVDDPGIYDWRIGNVFTAHMAKFLPTPGFVGRRLSVEELQDAFLPEHSFAMEVTRLNQGAFLAGIRMSDVILGTGGRSDFTSRRDFFHWCELLRRSGRDIQLRLKRGDAQLQLMVSQEHLNYRQAEKAPEVDIGFIIQELAANRGLRVGHVTKESGADRCGLSIGDRIETVDGNVVRYHREMQEILNRKTPGDLLRVVVRREGSVKEFSYILPGKEKRETKVAALSQTIQHPNQEILCTVTIDLPPDNHIYSMHQKGFGMPTTIQFKGSGYELINGTTEPISQKIEGGIEPMWIHEGKVEFKQKIRVTDPNDYFMLVSIYAQVCDESHCHEFRSVVTNNGSTRTFYEFRGNPELYSNAISVLE